MKLTKSVTVQDFDGGHFYARKRRDFAAQIGVKNVNTLREDEPETIIRQYLKTGEIIAPKTYAGWRGARGN